MLDYESRTTSYMVTVIAEDSLSDTTSIDVTIMVMGVDEPPVIMGQTSVEYAETHKGSVATFTAMDPEGTMVMWSVDPSDTFTIENGVLRFKESPDYEGGTIPYDVTVMATDETMKTTMKMVTVEVTNVDEGGEVTFTVLRPQLGIVIHRRILRSRHSADQQRVAVVQVHEQERRLHRHRKCHVGHLHPSQRRSRATT